MRVLFVCTGNTCRSPMAEAICRARHPDWVILSAGIGVSAPFPASANAAEAVKAYGGELDAHMSRRLTAELLEDADVVVPMTSDHARYIKSMFPGYEDKLRVCDEIRDPFGGDLDEYERCAERISKLVDSL